MMRLTLRHLAGAGLVLLALILIVLAVGWTERRPIATNILLRELARRGVSARFRVSAIGVRTQRLTNLVVGDPAHPDLVARSAEVRIAIGLAGVQVTGLSADGIRLRARIVDGRLTMGALDRLIPRRNTASAKLSLPELDLSLHDARAVIDTPNGQLGIAAEGSGWIHDGFAGRLAIAARSLIGGGCSATTTRAIVNIAVVDRSVMLDGPSQAAAVACGRVAIARPTIAIDARIAPDLQHWRGGARISAHQIQAWGALLTALNLQLGFEGTGENVHGGIDAQAGQVAVRAGTGRSVIFSGRFVAGHASQRVAGILRVDDAALAPTSIDQAAKMVRAVSETPVAPVARQLAKAVGDASRSVSVEAVIGVAARGDAAALQIEKATMTSGSGVQGRFDGAATLLLPTAAWRLDGRAVLAGGGLPRIELSARQASAGARLQALVTIAPMTAGAAQLALTPLHVDRNLQGRVQFATGVDLSGPLPHGGMISQLRLPLVGTVSGSGLSLVPRCSTARAAQLRIETLTLDPVSLQICTTAQSPIWISRDGVKGVITVAPIRLTGHIGKTPLTFDARAATIRIDAARFAASDLQIRLGVGAAPSQLSIAALEGGFAAPVTGTFAGLAGQLHAVPLAATAAAGHWRIADGGISADGTGHVADAALPTRLRPLLANDIILRVANGIVDATARLTEPKTGTTVAIVNVHHLLAPGRGLASIAVPGLTFGPKLQPDMLTPLTLGVVANVAGKVTGSGVIRWVGDTVTSEGRFTTDKLDLAAAFGEVKGIAGTIRFSDLIGRVTPPGQEVTIATINPGVEVSDGTVRYRLLPNHLVGIEGGSWPFAGGRLRLEPTVLDFDGAANRHLTMAVDGLDAARFIEQMKFENIAASGTFDGTLPLVFSATSNRISAGRLIARPGGGTLSYVGDVSNAQLGTFGKLAFDALKSLRYKSLEIDMDGALDGEIVSNVVVNGINQQPVGAKIAGLSRQLTGLPFRFNIAIKAPFRGLMNSARTFADPTSLIADQAAPAAVQPK